MTQHDQHQLDDLLHRLAAGVAAPDVPAEEDLSRGRRRVARRRLAVGGACLATAAVIGLGAAVGPGVVGADRRPDYAGGTAVPDPAPDSTPPLQPRESEVPRTTTTHAPMPTPPPDRHETLAAYQEVLAEHLDPAWDHLVTYTLGNGNQQTGSNGDSMTSLGSKYGWTNPGEQGLGMLQVSVNAGWAGTHWLCGPTAAAEGWTCRDLTTPGGTTAEVAEHHGVLAVAVEHDDGQVVILTADSLFANNSVDPVSGLGLTAGQLADAAADERLTLPGDVPDVAPAS